MAVQGEHCFGHDAFPGGFVLHCPASGITVSGSVGASTLTGAPEAPALALELVSAVEAAR